MDRLSELRMIIRAILKDVIEEDALFELVDEKEVEAKNEGITNEKVLEPWEKLSEK